MKNLIMSRKAGSASGGRKVLFLFCLVFLLAGCGQAAPKAPQAQNPAQPQEDKSLFSSIRDAFNRSLALRCEYTDEDGQKSVNYIKNKMIRTETVSTEGEQVYALFRDDKLYMWGPGSNQGMVFELAALQESNDVKMGGTTIHGTDDIINELENKKDQCQVQTLADSLFTVPQNVNFSNLNELLNQYK